MFIDDVRIPEDVGYSSENMPIFRSSQEAINELASAGCPKFISFDHDLGGSDIAINVVNFMIEADLECDGNFIPKDFTFNVHSANPVGAANIHGKLLGYLKFRK